MYATFNVGCFNEPIVHYIDVKVTQDHHLVKWSYLIGTTEFNTTQVAKLGHTSPCDLMKGGLTDHCLRINI